MSFLKKCIFGVASSAVLTGMVACSDKPTDVGGGVTDIGNSIAGVVVDASGASVPMARVVAYYDSWDQPGVSDSVETKADAHGNYELKVKKNAQFVLFASAGEECGLANADSSTVSKKISIGKRRAYSSHITERVTGRMRVVGSNKTTDLDGDGYFIFYDMPPGDVTISYADSLDDEDLISRVEFSTTGEQEVVVLPGLNFLEGDHSWLRVRDLRYYVDNGFDGILIRNPVSEVWTPITELPETDTTTSQVVVTVDVPQIKEPLTGFLFPIKVDTKKFSSTTKVENIVVVNRDKWELFPSEVEYWNDDEALLWVRIAGVDSGETQLNFVVMENAEYAATLIPFSQGQYYDGVLTRIHFNEEVKILDAQSNPTTDVASTEGLLGDGVTLKQGQYIALDSVLDLYYGDYTLSMWTKWEGPNGHRQVLASERGDSTFRMLWKYEDGEFSLMYGTDKGLNGISFGEFDIPVGEWVHVALSTFMGVHTMYVNGVPVGQSQFFSPFNVAKYAPLRVLGCSSAEDTWNGAVDEIRVEMKARSPEWLKAVYEQHKSAAK